MKLPAALHGTAAGAAVGFMLRPCCAGPALLSVFGVGGSSVAMFLASHRMLFLVLSTIMLVTSACINFRRRGGTFNKVLVLAATSAAFVIAARATGVL
jgi:hypothetical protein